MCVYPLQSAKGMFRLALFALFQIAPEHPESLTERLYIFGMRAETGWLSVMVAERSEEEGYA